MKKLRILLVLMLSITIFATSSCDIEESTQKKGQKEQEDIMKKAREAHPTPEIDHFLTRKNVVKWMETMDKPSKTFYIYLLTPMGDFVGYYVAEYRPVSVNTFLTPTKRIEVVGGTGVKMPSNALDGTHYGDNGGAGSQYFFFDAETGAYIEFSSNMLYIVMDEPLNINVKRLRSQN